MLNQLITGSLVIVATLLMQVAFVGFAIARLTAISDWFRSGNFYAKRIAILVAMTLWILAGLSAAVWTWALFYITMGVFDDIETAVYFSTVAFTTLGFGDITLDEKWRLTSALMAANGLILFSLNTAFLIEAMRRLFQPIDDELTAKSVLDPSSKRDVS
ncbi:MAG: ion channel [Pseudomonadota bacterium]